MLWLLLIVGVLITALAFPRVGKTIVRLFALLVALVILVPLALVVTFQRMRLKRRRRNAVRARAAAAAATESVEHGESPRLGPAIPSQ
jgi:energy-converting hydrogenase Eha subunit F